MSHLPEAHACPLGLATWPPQDWDLPATPRSCALSDLPGEEVLVPQRRDRVWRLGLYERALTDAEARAFAQHVLRPKLEELTLSKEQSKRHEVNVMMMSFWNTLHAFLASKKPGLLKKGH